MRFIKWIGAPGSLRFFLAGAGFSLILILFVRRFRRAGRFLLVALVGVYACLSLPIVAHGLAATLGDQTLPTRDYRPVDNLFVFDGDNLQGRSATAARLASLGHTRDVWLIGGSELKEAVLAAGFTLERIHWFGEYNDPPTTEGQMRSLKKHAQRRHVTSGAVIVSRLQAPRVVRLMEKSGLSFAVVAAPLNEEPPVSGVRAWLPNLAALALSREALYELAAVRYYAWKGWL